MTACAGKDVPLISIHAPREGGDTYFLSSSNSNNFISIHAPREGGDSKNSQNLKLFLRQVDNSFKYPLHTPTQFSKTGAYTYRKRQKT